MADYRCYFIDDDGHIRAVQSFLGASAADAIALARRVYAKLETYSGFELWRGDRCLHREGQVELGTQSPWHGIGPTPSWREIGDGRRGISSFRRLVATRWGLPSQS